MWGLVVVCGNVDGVAGGSLLVLVSCRWWCWWGFVVGAVGVGVVFFALSKIPW